MVNFGEIRLGDTARRNVLDALSENWITSGKLVKRFEAEWGKLFGYKYNKAVSSGTDAVLNLVASLYEFGAKRGDEVIVPALSFIATSNAVLSAGFTPVFVDVEEDMNIDPDLIEAAITSKTVAIIAVHTMGVPCNMAAINNIACKYNIRVFEDACEAHGAKYQNQFIGHHSDGAAFSFYTAHLINCGEGGMISTNNKTVAMSVDSTRSHGREAGSVYFNHIRVGFNSKMNDLEAAIGLEGIDSFWATFHTRKGHYYRLMAELREYDKYFNTFEARDAVICPHGLSIVVETENQLYKLTTALDDAKIEWKRNFGCIPTQHSAYEFRNYSVGDFPVAERLGTLGIHLGIHQHLTFQEIELITKTLRNAFSSF